MNIDELRILQSGCCSQLLYADLHRKAFEPPPLGKKLRPIYDARWTLASIEQTTSTYDMRVRGDKRSESFSRFEKPGAE